MTPSTSQLWKPPFNSLMSLTSSHVTYKWEYAVSAFVSDFQSLSITSARFTHVFPNFLGFLMQFFFPICPSWEPILFKIVPRASFLLISLHHIQISLKCSFDYWVITEPKLEQKQDNCGLRSKVLHHHFTMYNCKKDVTCCRHRSIVSYCSCPLSTVVRYPNSLWKSR